jgi:signal transduction histidine kinase
MGSQGDSLRIQISDQGPGIPEHELDLVYGKYYRGSRTRLVSGSGMGLYLVLRIVSQHAGGVGLANRPEGGTVVTITLPLPAQENAV